MTATVTAVRPFEMFDVEVARVTRVSSHLVRLTFTGETLDQFADPGYDQRIKVFLPPPAGSLADLPRGEDWHALWRALPPERQAVLRTYTTRAVRPHEREVDIDFVDHGDLGPASAFARRASRGDQVVLLGPNAAFTGAHGGVEFRADLADRTDLLIVGDDTAVPAVCRIVEQLPPSARGLVVLEVGNASEFQSLRAPEGVTVEWQVRQGRRGAAQERVVRGWLDAHPVVGSPATGETTVYFDGEDSTYWETTSDPGGDVPPLAAWIAGESSVVRGLRRLLVGEYRIPKSAVAFMGYWREGRSG